MDHLFSSMLPSNNESNSENLDSNHEEDAPFFGQFHSPSLDEILHNHHHQITANKQPPSPSKPKRVRKQRSAVDSGIEFDAASNKGKQLKVHDEINDSGNSKKTTKSDVLARELRGKARARARERTRERMILINNSEKSKQQMFGVNPNDDFDQLQLGFSANPNNHYVQESSSNSPNEYAGTHHFFDHTPFNNIGQKTEDYLGYGYNKEFANPPAGWLNSSNTFLGFLGGWDSQNFTESYGLLPNLAPLTVSYLKNAISFVKIAKHILFNATCTSWQDTPIVATGSGELAS
ncbi:hypothetical protein L1987_62823 [Smallanthus sonchifolius]|uniref:Uncharacterized protein n=1 Tax=Smallanthus sonchifolius TaxID=185202 RepID=A0ACB9CBI9_9ASTR|nr:hypothetical protein L1987_62823 [Smallanthus sonchifolius]